MRVAKEHRLCAAVSLFECSIHEKVQIMSIVSPVGQFN